MFETYFKQSTIDTLRFTAPYTIDETANSMK